MMFFLFFIAVVSNLLFNTMIPSTLGLEGEVIAILSFFPMLIYLGMNMVSQETQYHKDAVYVILLAVIIFAFKWVIGQDYKYQLIHLLIIPMILSICFDNLKGKEIALVRRIIIIFFLFECGLAMVEWVVNRNIFIGGNEKFHEIIENFAESEFFRSTSLMGHPLANAQIVAVLMTFIAVSNFKRKYIQIVLFFLGYGSLFCFNARAATLVVTLFTVPYFVWKINKATPKNKKWMMQLAVLCSLCGMFYMVTQTPIGGRLMNEELLDGSAQTRWEVFDFYKYYRSQEDFIWGHPDNYNYIGSMLGPNHVENGVIAWLMEYGIVFTIPMLLLLFRFQYRKLSVFSKFEKWLLLAVFYLIATMNPNLIERVQWALWVYAFYAFRPELLSPQTLDITKDE